MATDWIALEKKYYMQTVRRQPIVLVRGEGTRVWDDKGKEYLDFTSGWAVDTLGHSHPVVADAVSKQAHTLMQTSNQFYTTPQIELVQALVENSVLDRVFIGNSGAEANEGAVKLARKWGRANRDGAFEVITANNSFHGRTMNMIAATAQPTHHKSFAPIPEGFQYVPFNDVEAIMAATTDRTAAIMLEPVQGEGGVNIPDADYFKQVRKWCDEQGLLLMLDEVQTGIGRLGTLFGYEAFGIEPDVVTLAKGLGGGMPIGAFMAKEHACALVPGEHGSTFGGNPVTCAAANATVRYVIEHNIAGAAKKQGAIIMTGLKELKKKHSFITDVRGMGLLIAVQFDREMSAAVLKECNELGLLLNAVRPNAVRLMPPLTVSPDEISQALKRLDAGMTAAAKATPKV
ncbi:MAG: aspartate aminotransferase family protein [Chloroflexi bacterium]|nr:aspartate aminotransferase family protein [Chloroflexota bacterium]